MRIKVSYIDRVGIVFDIAYIFIHHQLNIISMEVGINVIFLETEPMSIELEQPLLRDIAQISDITAVAQIELMPHEEKAEQLKAVLDAVTDGVVAIDSHGCITQYNPAAEKIMHTSTVHVIGKPLTDIFPCCLSLVDSIQSGSKSINREIFFEQTNSHYLVSSHPIMDRYKKIIGGIAILKDIKDVRKMYQKLTEQPVFKFDEILHTSKIMQKVINLAKSYAYNDSTVLIRGETGTGKELFARALHSASSRSENIFVPINCAAIPDTLLESELFGYEDGAFTGATKGGKQGLFELANGGTLFLDEIGEVSAHLQVKLLRVLQERKIRRIGSRREFSIDVRLLAATNRNLEAMIEEGTFREDLYYRLNVIPLFLPPLRERKEDIIVLAQSFLQRFSSKLHKQADSINEQAFQVLTDYDWPGNIRELENVMERAVNVVETKIITPEHLMLGRHAANLEPILPAVPEKGLADILAEKEREILCRALCHYHTSRKLGTVLGLSHTSVLKKLQKYGLSFEQFKAK
ncbi:sigma 54-interacting transcriptional regulator [Propionispira raffinosivorans]|uniref:sigma 54-interacting transcriptional regulator n=1 Tax=Propionispira raffinosivorans TaxID=86959 RepID=UPI00036B77A3|nr:sigma 54-interacting transcriptional regulator [Propionispira raffinosivorans]